MASRKKKPKAGKGEKSIIRSSAAEYLIFIAASGHGGAEAVYADSALEEVPVIRKFRITAADGKRCNTQHYKLPAFIAAGYKVNSERAVQFCK